MAGLTTTTSLSPLVQAFYDKKFLIRAKHELVAYQLAQKRNLPGGVGKTVYFSRYSPLAKITSPLSETTTGGIDPANLQQLNIEETAATVALWGNYVQISKLASITSIDQEVSEKTDLLGQQAGESIDYYLLKKLSQGIQRRRADGDAAYQVEGTADSGSTTTLVDNALTQADDYWNGGYLVVTGGTNYGEVRQISDFDAATDTVTVSSAFPKAIDSTSTYRLVVGTGLVSTDVLSTANLRLAMRDLKRARSMKMEKGYNVILVNPDIEYDFMGDSTWQNAAVYKDRVDSLYEGEIGKWLGMRFVGTTQLFRESVAGVESESGAAHIAVILGKECFGAVELEGQKNKIYVKTPEQLAQPIPMYGTCGWQVGFEAKVLNGMFGVAILCGASA